MVALWIPINQWFSTGGNFGPERHWTISGDIWGYFKGVRLTTGIQGVEARDAVKCHTIARTAP